MYDNELLKVSYGPRGPRSMTSKDDPNGFQIGWEWLTGAGPQVRVLGAGNAFAQEFARSPYVLENLKKAVAVWKARGRGQIVDGDSYTNGSVNFDTPHEVLGDLAPFNSASQLVGSFGLNGTRQGDRLYWSADNTSGVHSATYGNQLDRRKLPSIPDASWQTGPLSNKHQRIDFVTDLDGNPIR